MTFVKRAALILALVVSGACAAASADEAGIRQALQAKLKMTVESVAPTPFPGVYEVVLNGQIFKICGIEIAARDQERAVGARGDGGDDVLDVALDIDAGFLVKLFLPLLVHRQGFLDAQSELRVHNRADIGIGDDGRVRGNVPQLDRSG